MLRLFWHLVRLVALTFGLILGIGTLALVLSDDSHSAISGAWLPGVLSLALLYIGIRAGRRAARAGDEHTPLLTGVAQLAANCEHVTIDDDGDVHTHVTDRSEAIAAMKELRQLKKILSLQKRANLVKQQAIRSEYTAMIRRQGSTWRGQHDAARVQLADSLQPLERDAALLDCVVIGIDSQILQLETGFS